MSDDVRFGVIGSVDEPLVKVCGAIEQLLAVLVNEASEWMATSDAVIPTHARERWNENLAGDPEMAEVGDLWNTYVLVESAASTLAFHAGATHRDGSPIEDETEPVKFLAGVIGAVGHGMVVAANTILEDEDDLKATLGKHRDLQAMSQQAEQMAEANRPNRQQRRQAERRAKKARKNRG